MSDNTTTSGNLAIHGPQASGTVASAASNHMGQDNDKQLEDQLDDVVIDEITMQAGDRNT